MSPIARAQGWPMVDTEGVDYLKLDQAIDMEVCDALVHAGLASRVGKGLILTPAGERWLKCSIEEALQPRFSRAMGRPTQRRPLGERA